VIESCNSTWLFDPGQRLFCRVPRGTAFEVPPPRSRWEPYFALDVDPNSVGVRGDAQRGGVPGCSARGDTSSAAPNAAASGTAELYLDPVAPGAS